VAGILDIKTREIPNELSLIILILAIPDLIKEPLNLLGLIPAIIMFIVSVFSKKEVMGGGDIKLMAGVGVFLGFFGATLLCLTSMTGVEIARFISKKKELKKVPFAPFISIGFSLMLIVGGIFKLVSLI
jgi:leader peptidase (prepilin peptidase)/N-methyltransferase